ncbi:hypothetical protein BD779DRAFT_1669332 [Infundibulicybe gibba]|nr:hypothetical protein BD779DRAFT_1669332 [Infundibulicybe gibba]
MAAPAPVNRHALTPVERQRTHLEKLLKDPAKPAYVPPPPKEKTVRPPREMMKNVQGSSAGAGSGEFHVYKASRRREYERLKLLDEMSQKEIEDAEFERKRKEAAELADSKTAKNRAKRQKKKERAKGKGPSTNELSGSGVGDRKDGDSKPEAPLKKRRLVNGKELIFRQPGDASDDEDNDEDPAPHASPTPEPAPTVIPAVVDTSKIIIHEDD